MNSALSTVQTPSPAEWLEARQPQDTDSQLRASLESGLDVTLRPVREGKFPTDGTPYSVVVGYGLERMTEAKRDKALTRIRAACTPPDKRRAEEWLIAMQAGMARRREDEHGIEVALSLYGAVLGRFPADVAKEACMSITLTGKWFPTVAEIEARCQRLGAARLALLRALEEWRAPTAEEQSAAARRARAYALRQEAAELERAIPASYRNATPRSQWEGEHLAAAEAAEARLMEARTLELGAR